MELFNDTEKTAYYVSAFGEVWSLRKSNGRWHELKPWMTTVGYLVFDFRQNGKVKHISVHRAVWEAFHGRIPEELEINHINCKRDDNRLENLELVTRQQNQLHPPTRQHKRESSRWRMKSVVDLTTGVVYESTKEAAIQTGLNQGNISNCCNGLQHHTGGHIFKFATEAA